jgi:hypothetical protein
MKRIVCLLVSLYGFTIFAEAQVESVPVQFITPNVADFVKFGNIPVSYYTGQAGYNIPLFNIQEQGFTAPVSLNYNASGFIANRPEGITGLNWYLSAGGTITRTVKGFPDDNEGLNVSASRDYVLPGFLAGVRQEAYNPEHEL